MLKTAVTSIQVAHTGSGLQAHLAASKGTVTCLQLGVSFVGKKSDIFLSKLKDMKQYYTLLAISLLQSLFSNIGITVLEILDVK